MYSGVREVRLLDGGFSAWERHGGDVAKAPAVPQAAARFFSGGAGACRHDLLATSAEVAAVSAGSGRGTIVDVRKRGEYEGWLTDNYGFFASAGHIPSAVHQGNWDELVQTGENDDLKLRSLQEVAARRPDPASLHMA